MAILCVRRCGGTYIRDGTCVRWSRWQPATAKQGNSSQMNQELWRKRMKVHNFRWWRFDLNATGELRLERAVHFTIIFQTALPLATPLRWPTEILFGWQKLDQTSHSYYCSWFMMLSLCGIWMEWMMYVRSWKIKCVPPAGSRFFVSSFSFSALLHCIMKLTLMFTRHGMNSFVGSEYDTAHCTSTSTYGWCDDCLHSRLIRVLRIIKEMFKNDVWELQQSFIQFFIHFATECWVI